MPSYILFMIYRDYVSWWLRPRFLQPLGKPAPILFAGPFAGEFGWELMNWQAFLRWLAPKYQKVIVCCREGNQALYRDFAQEFVTHNLQGVAECNQIRQIRNPEEWRRVLDKIPPGADHLLPVGWQPQKRKIFIPLGGRREDLQVDVVIHARGRQFGSFRNWEKDKWDLLVEKLNSRGLRLACVGLSSATLALEGVDLDFRDRPLEDTLNLMASASLVVGPSSGPMHLASLCQTPHLVWTDAKGYARGRTNREKYERWWNPFATKTMVLDAEGFDPAVETVLKGIMHLLGSKD